MNHKIFEDWISYVAGVFGFGVFWTNVHWGEVLPKIMFGAASALFAGYIGYQGKSFAIWSNNKIRAFFRNIKKNKNESIH